MVRGATKLQQGAVHKLCRLKGEGVGSKIANFTCQVERSFEESPATGPQGAAPVAVLAAVLPLMSR